MKTAPRGAGVTGQVGQLVSEPVDAPAPLALLKHGSLTATMLAEQWALAGDPLPLAVATEVRALLPLGRSRSTLRVGAAATVPPGDRGQFLSLTDDALALTVSA